MEPQDRRKPFDGILHVSYLPAESAPSAVGEVSVAHWLKTSGGGEIDQANIQQNFGVQIKFAERKLHGDAIEIIGDFQDLISIAANAPAEYTQVVLVSNDVPLEMLSGPHATAKESIAVHANWIVRDKKGQKELWPHDYIFQYEDIGGVLGLSAWADYSTEFRFITKRIMATRYSKHMYVSDRFGNRIAALEAWDKKISGDHAGRNLGLRLRRLAAGAAPAFSDFVGDVDRWADIVHEERNAIFHHDAAFLNRESSDQYCLAESLYWLYVALILRAIKSPDRAFERLWLHPQVEHWRPRIRELVARRQPRTRSNV
jgi:hypothetical protein